TKFLKQLKKVGHIADLVQYTPPELHEIRSFGHKWLIKAIKIERQIRHRPLPQAPERLPCLQRGCASCLVRFASCLVCRRKRLHMPNQLAPVPVSVFAREPALSTCKLDRLASCQALGLFTEMFRAWVLGQRSCAVLSTSHNPSLFARRPLAGRKGYWV